MFLAALLACTGDPTPSSTDTFSTEGAPVKATAVTISGQEGAYTFAVSISSDETGCDQYANWWEVVNEQGELVYRRILNHSHPDEQPFTRDGGPIQATAEQVLTIRAHNHPDGYGTVGLKGSVKEGFTMQEVTVSTDLETVAPLPEECWF